MARRFSTHEVHPSRQSFFHQPQQQQHQQQQQQQQRHRSTSSDSLGAPFPVLCSLLEKAEADQKLPPRGFGNWGALYTSGAPPFNFMKQLYAANLDPTYPAPQQRTEKT